MAFTSLRDQTHLVYRFDAGADGAIWLARQLCEQWLHERHVRSDVIPDLLLATTEMCTGLTGDAVLRVGAEDGDVHIQVESGGSGIVVIPATDDETERAGNLRLAAACCDELVLHVTPERTVVRARRHGVVLPE